MYLNELPAKTGYQWFRQGIQLFCHHPLNALSVFLTYIFGMMALSLVPKIGFLLPLLLIPGLSVGFMGAGREIAAGQPVSPLILISGFRAYGRTIAHQLLVLGVLYIVATFITLAISALVDDGALMRLMISGAQLDNQKLASSALPRAMLVALIAYIPIALLFWFAPTLIAWHHIPPHKALFFSAVSCWRNRGAFFVYSLLWIGLAITASSTLTILFHLFGAGTLLTTVLMPFSLVLTSMFYCSFHATYHSCFNTDAKLSKNSAAAS